MQWWESKLWFPNGDDSSHQGELVFREVESGGVGGSSLGGVESKIGRGVRRGPHGKKRSTKYSFLERGKPSG